MSRPADQFDIMALDDFEELLADRPRDERWELIDRRVIRAPIGTRWEHNVICQNVAFGLLRQLRERDAPYVVFRETFFMKSTVIESATLPDVMICPGPLPPGASSVDDPVLLGEVVTPGSAARDRHEKWHAYRRLPSLRHYILVERDRAKVEVFDILDNAHSVWRTFSGLDAVLELPALNLSLPLAEIYRDVLTP